MAREVRNYAVTVPAGTAQATPQVTALAMPARIVRRVRVRIPPGPFGVVGFALSMSGQRIVPWGDQQWFVGNDEALSWDLEGMPTSGAWQLQAYNTGNYAHTLYLTFELDPPQAAAGGATLQPLDLSA